MSTQPYTRSGQSNRPIPNALKELVEYLNGLTDRAALDKLGELLNRLDISRRDLDAFTHFGSTTYRRNLICENDWYELLCICWRSGQRSPIHNHAGSTCGLRIIEGIATETLFKPTDCGQIKAVSSFDCGKDSVCTAQDADIHQVSNLQAPGRDLITLHIYSPPLRTMETYSLLGEVHQYTPTNYMTCEYMDGI